MLKKIQDFTLNIYIILWFLVAYSPISKMVLYCITFLSFIWTSMFFKDFFLNKKNINKYVLILIIAFIFSFLCNARNMFQLSYYIININTIISIYWIIKNYGEKLLEKIFFFTIIFSIINCMIYLLIKPDYIGVKFIKDIKIVRVQINMLPISIASVLSVLSFYMCNKYQSKKKYIVKMLNVYLIIRLGKISTLGTLMFVILISNFIYFLKSNKNIKKFLKFLFGILILINFLMVFIIVSFQRIYNLSNFTLLTLRENIWRYYINYVINQGNILFGTGFIESNNKILNMTNPHNQYLGIFIVLGLVGMIAFFICFIKILENTLEELYLQNKVPFQIFLTLVLLMFSDSYFILTAFPLHMTLLMSFLIIYSKVNKD